MIGMVLRAGAWPTVLGLTGLAAVLGACGTAFPTSAGVLFPIGFALLAAAAAFTLDESASAVVDVTPTRPVRRTGIRALALLAPLAVGAAMMLAGSLREVALPWPATALALLGHVLLGFAAACVIRTRTGEPGPVGAAAVALALLTPNLVPRVALWVTTFPASDPGGPSSNKLWSTVLPICLAAIAVTADNRQWRRQISRP
jgi:hypothetical protein